MLYPLSYRGVGGGGGELYQSPLRFVIFCTDGYGSNLRANTHHCGRRHV